MATAPNPVSPAGVVDRSRPLAILHVDDSAPNRYRRRRVLEPAGFDVIETDSGASALAMLDTERVDILLVDVRLPDVSGFDLARAIKTHAARVERDLAVVLISAHFIESEARVRGLESGADAYLIEPVTNAELVATLRAVGRTLQQLGRIREHQRLLDAVFEYVPEGITVASAPDATITRVSRHGQLLAGRSAERLENIPAAEHVSNWAISRAGGTLPDASELPLTRAVVDGEIVTDEEWVLSRPDGTQICILCNAGPIRDAAGRITGGVIAWRDITARKEMEHALRRQAEELRAADRAKNEFLAAVVHELKQPIQAVIAAVEVMKSRLSRETGESARDVIERQARQLSRITDDLLDAARVVRGQVTMDLQPADLTEILRRAFETARPAIEERDHRVEFAPPDVPVPVTADASRMQQVFVNVLTNAARYTPRRGTISVHFEVSASQVTTRVKDTGKGIARADLARIFELFSRASSRGGGLGIGLAVARRIVERHRGTIEARSEGSGRGSEFAITLPLRKP